MGQWLCDTASIYNRWALQQHWKSPGNTTKNKNNELSASIFTSRKCLFKEFLQTHHLMAWVSIPHIREKHLILAGSCSNTVENYEFKMNVRGAEFWNDYSTVISRPTGNAAVEKKYLDVITNHLLNIFLQEDFKKSFILLRWSTIYQHKYFMLTGSWPHLVGIYLEFNGERITVQHRSLRVHEQACVSKGTPNVRTTSKQRIKYE